MWSYVLSTLASAALSYSGSFRRWLERERFFHLSGALRAGDLPLPYLESCMGYLVALRRKVRRISYGLHCLMISRRVHTPHLAKLHREYRIHDRYILVVVHFLL